MEPKIDLLIVKLIGDGPRIIYGSDVYKIEEYVSVGKIDVKSNKKCIARKIRELHSTNPHKNFRTFSEMMMNMTNNDDFLIKIANRVLLKLGNQDVLCHNDIQIGNILNTERGILFIDYEFASLNDPRFDLANFFCEMINWSDDEKREFITFYGMDYTLDEIYELECVSHYLWYLYGRERTSLTNFDFKEYALMRLRKLKEMDVISDDEYRVLSIFR